jgi:hypothetical protein
VHSPEAESLRQEFFDKEFLPASGAAKDDARFAAEFVNYLATRATGRTRSVLAVYDGDCLNFHLRTEVGDGREDRGTFRTICDAVGSVFDIATGKKSAGCGQEGCADVKFRIRRVRVFHGRASGFEKTLARLTLGSRTGHLWAAV